MAESLMNSDDMRRYIGRIFAGCSHAQIGAELGLSAGFVGMVLSGAREPSKAILDAVGFEKVTFFRPKRSER